jgi:hypothetical protein
MNETNVLVSISEDKGIGHAVVLEKSNSRLAIVRFVAESDMHQAGLEKDYKKLVSMIEVASSFRVLLKAYIDIGKLDLNTWDDICLIYKPFISQVLAYEYIKKFMDSNIYNI